MIPRRARYERQIHKHTNGITMDNHYDLLSSAESVMIGAFSIIIRIICTANFLTSNL